MALPVTLVLLSVTTRDHASVAASVYTFRVAGEVCAVENAPICSSLSGIRVTLMVDPKSRPFRREAANDTGSPGLRAPVKGESSASNNPPLPEGATMGDPVPRPPRSPDPDATLVDVDATADIDATIVGGLVPPSPPPRQASGLFVSAAVLQPGDVLGGRYEILQLLGEGGMGAVYKARDRELDRFIALKLIRPELAASPAILARFKQELLLAHQVTHKNVIRIYDLSEADGVKFITMEFIEGVDLRRLLLDHGKLAPTEAVDLIRQVCFALHAAHTVGVIHRDLKPQNIMQDAHGRILVMDFGLARSVGSDGMTQTGALVGTMEYMSPEQAMGSELDQRSDIFALGLIFFELLTGKMPYKADTALASLLKRNSERAIPAVDLDPSVPKGLSDIVGKCLERDVNARYGNAQEILDDLDAWRGDRPVLASTVSIPVAQAPKKVMPWKWVGAGMLAALVVAGGWLLRGKSPAQSGKTTVQGPVASLAILPFRNASGDPNLDWLGSSIAEMLSTDVGQSASLRTVSADRLHQVLSDLHMTGNTQFDPATLRQISESSNADTLVLGQYVKFGDQIRIDASLQDLRHDRRVPLKIEAASEKDIPGAIDRLADAVRHNLAVSPEVIKELQSSSFQPTSTSVEALRDYNQGVGLQREGKNLEAQKQFEAATKADPIFALGFSKLAQAYSILGYDNEAEQAARKAVDLSQNLPEAEKYLIAAVRAQITKNFPDAIKAYENLAKASPDNPDVRFALGSVYEDGGDLEKARSNYETVLKADPNNLNVLLAMGRVAIKSGNAQAGLDPLNRALSLAVRFDNQEQKALILLAMGIAYRGLNKPDEALRDYQQSLEINRQLGQKRGVAANLLEMAQVQTTLGKPDAALASQKQALDIYRQIGAKKETGDTLIDIGNLDANRGQYDAALDAYKQSLQIQRDAGDEAYQALCLNNIGNVYLNRGDNDNALTYLQQALQLREKLNVPADIAETLHNAGGAYANIGQYEQAMSSYMRAIELFRKAGDNVGVAELSHAMALVFQAQGRYGAALNAIQDALKPLRETGDKSPRMAQFLADLGGALGSVGRMSEASKPLDEADSVARPLKNDSLQAVILNNRADVAFYSGDGKRAKELYSGALRAAAHGSERETILAAKMNVAKVTLAEGHSVPASELRQLADQADALGLRDRSVEASVYVAEGMINSKDYTHARETLERNLGPSEKMGLRMQTAKIRYLLGTSLRLSGHSADAAAQYREFTRLLDDMKKEAGAEKLLERADLKSIYEESTRWASAAKN